MVHDHAHAPAAPSARAGARHRRRLTWVFGLLSLFMVVEVATGLWSHSLGLLSDAGHLVTDVIGMGMSIAAIRLADRDRRGGPEHRTFGLYRLEILAALANAVLLFGVAIYVMVEAVIRLWHPAHVATGPVLAVATVGLAANLVAYWLLREGAAESLNVQSASLEVLSDTFGSLGVIVGMLVLRFTGWSFVDPLVGVAIGLFILPRTLKLGAQAVRILVQAAPVGTDMVAMRGALGTVAGVVDVHDLHVWTLTSDMVVATAHLMVEPGADSHGVLDQAAELLRRDFDIAHATLQVEPDNHEGCEKVAW